MKGTPMSDTLNLMHVMAPSGDTKVIWDPANAAEVASAQRTFTELRGKGFTAYSVTEDGRTDAILTAFDPTAARIIMKPAFAGG
jgi:hypothetical protein